MRNFGKSYNKKANIETGENYYVYVILCEDHFYYIGISLDPEERFKLHTSGKGARFTKEHPPIKMIEKENTGTNIIGLAMILESYKVKECIKKYGHNNIGGGQLKNRKKKIAYRGYVL